MIRQISTQSFFTMGATVWYAKPWKARFVKLEPTTAWRTKPWHPVFFILIHSVRLHLIALLGIFLVGCAPHPKPITGDRVTIFVPGVAGNGPGYAGLIKALEKDGNAVEVFSWGSPIITINFSDPQTHAQAERELANRLVMIPDHVKRIDIIAHSAGCGVVLGAMQYTNRIVHNINFLSPSVSPGYDLTRPLKKSNRIDSFYSDQDQTFLKWRTGNFGTYDGVKTAAAGHAGFETDRYPPELSSKLRQHPYDPAWKNLGNDGGHFGGISANFIKTVVLPIMNQ